MAEENDSSTALQILSFRDSAVRMKLIDGEPWWILNDVCAALGIKNPYDTASRLDKGDLGTTEVSDANGHTQHMNVINEPALYEVIALSRKPEAKAFKRWVTHEVLPSLRKTGSYSLPAAPVSTSQLSGKALLAAAVLEAQKTIDSLEAENRALKPKAAYTDAVGAAENTLTMGRFVRIA